jgi:hypothetical protein
VAGAQRGQRDRVGGLGGRRLGGDRRPVGVARDAREVGLARSGASLIRPGAVRPTPVSAEAAQE